MIIFTLQIKVIIYIFDRAHDQSHDQSVYGVSTLGLFHAERYWFEPWPLHHILLLLVLFTLCSFTLLSY